MDYACLNWVMFIPLWSVGPAAELPGKAATNTGRERPAGLYWHTQHRAAAGERPVGAVQAAWTTLPQSNCQKGSTSSVHRKGIPLYELNKTALSKIDG
eukprot:CAMPEP_0177756266 /NCGR_PEP_ID=MMETSP0491_2-20121128/3012_1 /TAXON_ID=63592 /ORGANISM="Tetraselmis chuii, Strain PLY429" /LENGTH=97 /DNA_ID=CAMNT_0019271827 /DNA_START=573 /DNA_END=866 /DNA_ORIENTATION=-